MYDHLSYGLTFLGFHKNAKKFGDVSKNEKNHVLKQFPCPVALKFILFMTWMTDDHFRYAQLHQVITQTHTSAHHMGTGPHGSSRGSPSAQLPCSLAPSSRAIPLEQRGLGRCGVTQLLVALGKKTKREIHLNLQVL